MRNIKHLVWLSLLFASVNAGAQTVAPNPTGSISGRVTVDGKGVGGIPVAAVPGQSINVRDAPNRAITNAEGDYYISGLPDGNYLVWSVTPEFIADETAGPSYLTYTGAVKAILLAAGENVTGVDLKLIRGAVITGRVTTADNKPVVDEHITLQLLDRDGSPRLGAVYSNYDQMLQTDDRGIYRVFGLKPGRYRVSTGYDPANESVTRNHRYEKSFYPDPNDPTKPGIVEVKEGDEARDIDMKVEPAPPTYAISGHVTDKETGVPIAKAGVQIMPLQQGTERTSGGLTIQTDERGEFSWNGFAPGRYAVSATSDPYGGNFYGEPLTIDVVDKDATGLELKTIPGLSLSGFISAEGLPIKELLTRVKGLTIIASDSSNGPVHSTGRSVVAADGSFQIDGLKPGPRLLFISSEGPPFVRLMIARVEREGVVMTEKLDVQQSMSGLQVVLEYGTGTIRGTVKIESDEPITSSHMTALYKREGAREAIPVQVDARGNFVITNVSPGTFEVILSINFLSPPQHGIAPQRQLVKVANGEEAEVNFTFDLRKKQPGP